MIVGSGAHRFRWLKGWGRLPDGMTLGDVPGVAVDSQDRVFAFQRGEPPIVVFDREGEFVTSWGDGVFKRTHSIHITGGDSVYCVDDVGQAVRRFSIDGRLDLEITAPDQSEATGYRRGYHRSVQRSAPPFCFPTAAAPSHDGRHVMVTDGYGNARLHRFDQAGELVSPNNIVRGPDGYYYTAELGRTVQGPPGAKFVVEDALSPRVTVRDSSGAILAEWGASEPERVWFAPHGIAIDSRGDLYVGEVSASNSYGLAPQRAALHKFLRLD